MNVSYIKQIVGCKLSICTYEFQEVRKDNQILYSLNVILIFFRNMLQCIKYNMIQLYLFSFNIGLSILIPNLKL